MYDMYACSKTDPKCIDENHQHILTGGLGIISDPKFKKLVSKGSKYRDLDNLS